MKPSYEELEVMLQNALDKIKASQEHPREVLVECISGAISKHITQPLLQREVLEAAKYIAQNYAQPPIPPELAELQRELTKSVREACSLAVENAELRKLVEEQKAEFAMPDKLHPDTKDLVKRFAFFMATKLRKAEQKYGYSNGWKDSNWMDECRVKLVEHMQKGDPIDVANYCAFLWHHGESTADALDKLLESKVPEEKKVVECWGCEGNPAGANDQCEVCGRSSAQPKEPKQ